MDCHEYARAEYPLEGARARLRWLLFIRPYVDAILQSYLPRARAVSTVCDGIAELLEHDYRLPERPATVRSLPEFQPHPYRPCGETIRVLYHGIAAADRGLEQVIDSVRLWRPEFKLCLRLVSNEEYIDSLKERAVRNSVRDRVEFLEPVLYTDLIRRAAEADVGYCVLENFSPQRLFVLPNKFFEYAMAGLAVVCSDLPEMRQIGDRYGHCVFVDRPDPALIAETINALSANAVNRLKRKAVEAARELCWENEQKRLIEAYLGPADNEFQPTQYWVPGIVAHVHGRARRLKRRLYEGAHWIVDTFVPEKRRPATREFIKSFLKRTGLARLL